jgi:murein DD-endopeptidase MepM/ murein hydrolase activator NlpD
MINKNKTKKVIRAVFFSGALLLIVFSAAIGNAQETQERRLLGNTTVLDLNEEISSIKKRIRELESEKEEYQREIENLREESVSLSREVSLLNNRIAQLTVEVAAEQAKIDQTSLEIQNVDLAIVKTTKRIAQKKDQLGNLIERLGRIDSVDYLGILLFHDDFASFFDTVKHLERVEEDVFQVLSDIEETKVLLAEQKSALEDKRTALENFKGTLEEKRLAFEDQEQQKAHLLSQTRSSQRRFEGLLFEIKKEQDRANAEILSLERQVRERLAKEQALASLGGDESFIWPVNPSRGISAYFHDPSYPYRYLFEHPAVDIRAEQGTAVRASKSGYVGRAKDAGLEYSYIMLIHDDNITTVYGHVSAITVREDDYVVQGQVIGRTGGTPGTPGAGRLSTGPHLHFEIRSNGIPVDPLQYLP